MPTYEYRCPNDHHFELFQRMSDPAVAKCPECGADAVRLMSKGGGLIFKGSGFYTTDYRGDSYKKSAEADSGSGEGTAKPAEPKADAGKPDAAAASSATPPPPAPPPPPPPAKGE
jgi:putative FmdB family regulatory protein